MISVTDVTWHILWTRQVMTPFAILGQCTIIFILRLITHKIWAYRGGEFYVASLWHRMGRGAQTSHKSRTHLKILSVRRVT